jgi:chromosomal replication initiator protein
MLVSQPEHPEYVFRTFVVSEGSCSAWEAAVAVADGVGLAPNPLFLYGPVGSGKTHLLHAIAQRSRAKRPEAGVKRMVTRALVDRLISAIRADEVSDWRKNLMTLDCLLLDDFSLAEDRRKAAEELLRQFGEWVSAGVQIVVTCDARSVERSLEWGRRALWTDVGAIELHYPDRDARIEILRRVAAARALLLSEERVEELAGHCSAGARECQSLVARIAAEAALVPVVPVHLGEILAPLTERAGPAWPRRR